MERWVVSTVLLAIAAAGMTGVTQMAGAAVLPSSSVTLNSTSSGTGGTNGTNGTGGTANEFTQVPDYSGTFNLSYFGILNGPTLTDLTTYRPDMMSVPNQPVVVRNFLGLGYNLNNNITVSGTAYWNVQPVLNPQVQIQDPFLKISDNSLFQSGNFNLYSDVRFHFPVTSMSQASDLKMGVQSVNALTFIPEGSRFVFGLYASLWSNFYGQYGYGDDIFAYLGPNVSYQISPTLALTVLYDLQASHVLGDDLFNFYSNGTDLEPGIFWDITPRLSINPYLNILPGGNMSFSTTSFGMYMSWLLI